MNGTNWMPGIIVLATALVMAGAYVVLTLLRTRAGAPPGAADAADAEKQRAELDARYRAAIDQLRELKAEQHHLTPEAYEAQRAELEKRAADALRAKESRALPAGPSAPASPAAAAAAAAPAPSGFFGRHPEWKGAIWGGGVVAFFGLLGFLLFREAKPADPMGERAQPAGPMQAQGKGQQPGGGRGDELDRALEHVRAHPEDVESASMVAHELIRRQEWDEASQITERALGADPFHVEHRIHRAVLKATRGDPGATDELQRLADTYPDAEEALLFLASMVAQAGDKARALDALERYVSAAPPEAQSVELYQAMAELRRELGRPPAP